MDERAFRRKIATKLFNGGNVVVEELWMRYSVGKMEAGADFGMPDHYFDIVQFENGAFDLYELKMIDASDLWNGKYFGQMLWYNFLFHSEPWNELAGRFAMRADKGPHLVHGDIGKVLVHLADFGDGEVAEEDDPDAKFRSLNLVVCGGKGYELAAKYNPAIWSMWIEFSDVLRSSGVDFRIFNAFEEGELQVFNLTELDIADLPTRGSRAAWAAAHDAER